MAWVKIDKDKALSPGDIVELDFRILSGIWLSSFEVAMIEAQLANRHDFEILSNSLPAAGIITFTIKVKDQYSGSWLQPPGAAGFVVTTTVILLTVAKIAAAICAVGLVTSLLFYEARQFVKEAAATPSGKLAMSGVGAAGWALLAFVVYKYILGK